MNYQTITFATEGPVATLTLNRPEKLNALNQEMLRELTGALTQIQGQPEIRALILTGAGRAFIAGADVELFTRMDPETARQFAQAAHRVGLQVEALEIPVIAAVNGYALGGGCEMALACDFIYAAQTAQFGQPEINLGIIPGFGGTQRLARLLGPGRAKELCLTGRMISAAEALAMGLVARVFPPEDLLTETRQVARALAEKSRVALKEAKQAIDRGLELDLKGGCALEIEAFARCFSGPDAHEGARAFLEKRPPRFAGS